MSTDVKTNKETKAMDKKVLVTKIIQVFQPAIVRLLGNGGLDKDHFWLVVARYKMNKKQFCDEECDTGVHFHDSDDWFGEDERKALKKFWKKLKPHSSIKSQKYVDELVQFTKEHSSAMIQTIRQQTESTRDFLETIISKDSQELIEVILEDDEILKSFPFYCAVVCMIMEYHGKEDEQERLGTGWFELFFQFLLSDLDDDDTSSDESEQDDDDDESDEEPDEKLDKVAKDKSDKQEKKPIKRQRRE